MDAEDRKPQQEEVERWLDTALRARADVEPRIGVENRVLARLAAEPERTRFAFWPVLMGVAAVVLIAIAVVIMRSGTEEKPIVRRGEYPTASQPVDHRPAIQARTVTPGNQSKDYRPMARGEAACCVSTRMAASRTPDEGIRRSGLHPNATREQREPLPRLAAFPAPRPETAEERMLLRLAARRDSYELAASSTHAAPLRDLSVPEIKIDPMEGTPPDDNPRE